MIEVREFIYILTQYIMQKDYQALLNKITLALSIVIKLFSL